MAVYIDILLIMHVSSGRSGFGSASITISVNSSQHRLRTGSMQFESLILKNFSLEVVLSYLQSLDGVYCTYNCWSFSFHPGGNSDWYAGVASRTLLSVKLCFFTYLHATSISDTLFVVVVRIISIVRMLR